MIFKKLYQRLALNNLVTGRYEKAKICFEKILEKNGPEPGIFYNLGLSCIALGEYAQAVAILEEGIDRYGEGLRRAQTLADACYFGGRREDALKWYKRALESTAEECEINLLNKRIEICKKEASFRSAVEGYASFLKGVELFEDKKYDEAAEHFDQAYANDPTNVMAGNNLGSIYMNHHKNHKEALKIFKRILKYSRLPLIQKNLEMCRYHTPQV